RDLYHRVIAEPWVALNLLDVHAELSTPEDREERRLVGRKLAGFEGKQGHGNTSVTMNRNLLFILYVEVGVSVETIPHGVAPIARVRNLVAIAVGQPAA